MNESLNYFNYFTEIEEHFQKARGTSLFLLSPLDWALIESWKNSGVPLESVLTGIDAAFEKWRSKRSRTQNVNSLAFCSQAVMQAAERGGAAEESEPPPPPFQTSDIQAFLDNNLQALRAVALFDDIAAELALIASEAHGDLEQLEQRLSALESRMIAIAQSRQTQEEALQAKREMDAALSPYRRKMSAPQLAMLERQFLERKLLESTRLPRLSLFYIR